MQRARRDRHICAEHWWKASSCQGGIRTPQVAGMLLDGRELEFYRYDGEVRPKLDAVRDRLNDVAEAWTREQKDRCLDETEKSFAYSGGLLRTIVQPPDEVAAAPAA